LVRALTALLLLLLTAGHAAAQVQSAPQPLPMPAPIPAPKDVAYPGVMTLFIDATDLDRRIYRVRQTIPVSAAGPMTLLYTEWLPGAHAPRGPVHNYAGLTIKANGKAVPWTRDPINVYAFHVEVPAGARALEIEAQFLTPLDEDQGAILVTPQMLRLQWHVAALYPAGHFTRQIKVEPSVRLPAGWDYGVALDVASSANGVVTFKPVSFDTLVDSPMFAGRYFRKIDLDPGGRSRVTLNVMADTPDLLEAKPEVIAAHREMVRQFDRLFGARHFDRYDFLLSLSDQLTGSGLEHHRSSENGVDANYFKTWDTALISRDLLPHEGVHSWNGKYRRPADLWTADFATPMRDSLLWVYEGQTQYWGNVVAARAGLVEKQQALDLLAGVAATYDTRVGRAWRPLADTTNDPIIAARRDLPWRSWQRSEDYYSEGQLIWLDVDTLIRERSKGARSLDNFAKGFFGMNDGDWGEVVYHFEDVVAALNAVEPYDWAAFLRSRIDVTAKAPLDGLRRGGYRLVYADEPNAVFKANETRRKIVDLTYSIGVVAEAGGKLTAVQWDSPAFKAGLTSGSLVVAVNGMAFTGDRLKAAITAKTPIDLLIRQGDLYKTVRLDYAGGHRYPRLERIEGTPALLDDILARKPA